jgi:hypothetical protein
VGLVVLDDGVQKLARLDLAEVAGGLAVGGPQGGAGRLGAFGPLGDPLFEQPDAEGVVGVGRAGVGPEEFVQTPGPAEADALKPRRANGFDRRPRHVAEEKVRLVALELLATFPLLFGEERLIRRRPVDL